MPACDTIRRTWLGVPWGRRVAFWFPNWNDDDLGGGEYLSVRVGPAWCRCCGGIRGVEVLGSPPGIDQHLGELDDPDPGLGRLHRDDPAARRRWRDEALTRRGWRERRSSPPKCLECGSPDVIPLPEGRTVRHPGGAGGLRDDGADSLVCGAVHLGFFSPEGDRIAQDRRAVDDALRRIWPWSQASAPGEAADGGTGFDINASEDDFPRFF